MFDKEIEQLLYSKVRDQKIVTFEQLVPPCRILQLLTLEDIYQLNKLARSAKYSSRPKEKFALMNRIMEARGFKKLAAGTNRIVYKFLEDQSIVVKVAHCKVALTDNIREMENQNILAPFVAKCFEVSPCGTVGLFERVSPISNRQQFLSVASDIYDIIINHFLGRYVLDDFGSKYFMNWGVRAGAFPVLLDYPYVYELDGAKLYCNKPDPYSETGYCGGEIDFDDGFNHLVCQKCGKTYFASELKNHGKDRPSILVDAKGDIDMEVLVIKNGNVISDVDTTKETAVYEKTRSGKPKGLGLAKREKRRVPNMEVVIERGPVEEPVEPEFDDNQIPKTPEIDVIIKKSQTSIKPRETRTFGSDVVVNYAEDEPTVGKEPEVSEPVLTEPEPEKEPEVEPATDEVYQTVDIPEDKPKEPDDAVQASDMVEIVPDDYLTDSNTEDDDLGEY